MKVLYFECNMGAAGDMIMSALSELIPNQEEFVKRFNNLGIPNVNIDIKKAVKCGITGSHINVYVDGVEESEEVIGHRNSHDEGYEHSHEENHVHSHKHSHEENHVHSHKHSHEENHVHSHKHSHDGNHVHSHEENHGHSHEHSHEENHSHSYCHIGMKDIETFIIGLNVNEAVKENAIAIYNIIAEAESKAHNCSIENIHFHEVGTMDAVADVVGCCMLIDEIKADKIIATPINTGYGQVKCAHGILPIPAPATANILKGIPIYASVKGELCTPTGAAILKHFVNKFMYMPIMSITGIGYGMGTKDFETANCIRAVIGETNQSNESVVEIRCNVDDMTGEAVAFAMEKLFDAGALDVFTTPIGMKKNRPAILITAICNENKKSDIIKAFFKYTTTIGVREYTADRYVLNREEAYLDSNYGKVKAKISSGFDVKRIKAEFEDLKKIANENNISLSDIKLKGE